MQQRVGAVARFALCVFDNGEQRAFEAVPEDRERGRAVALVDRVIAPGAAHYLVAVDLQQLIELGAAEEDAPLPAVIAKPGNGGHGNARLRFAKAVHVWNLSLSYFTAEIQRACRADRPRKMPRPGFAGTSARRYGTGHFSWVGAGF